MPEDRCGPGVRRVVLLLLLCLVGTSGAAPRQDLWGSILSRYVDRSGLVAYRSLAEHDRGTLDAYLDSLGDVDLEQLTRDERVAFWLNAYNALVLWAVVHGERPVTPEGRSRFYRWVNRRIAGEPLTLDEIEQRLRPHAALDPRIHFARANGTLSGPRLHETPFEGDRLDAQLAVATRRLFRRPSFVEYDLEEKRLVLPLLFAWYREDFERTAGSLPAYVRRHVRHPVLREFLRSEEVTLEFRRAEWSLNAAPREAPG